MIGIVTGNGNLFRVNEVSVHGIVAPGMQALRHVFAI